MVHLFIDSLNSIQLIVPFEPSPHLIGFIPISSCACSPSLVTQILFDTTNSTSFLYVLVQLIFVNISNFQLCYS